MNTRKSTLIAAAISLALAKHAAADSQETASPASEEVETVLVTGIRASLDKSLDVKREANARLEVVTAEDVGKLPAHNVADALRGLPGVNISSASAAESGLDACAPAPARG